MIIMIMIIIIIIIINEWMNEYNVNIILLYSL